MTTASTLIASAYSLLALLFSDFPTTLLMIPAISDSWYLSDAYFFSGSYFVSDSCFYSVSLFYPVFWFFFLLVLLLWLLPLLWIWLHIRLGLYSDLDFYSCNYSDFWLVSFFRSRHDSYYLNYPLPDSDSYLDTASCYLLATYHCWCY